MLVEKRRHLFTKWKGVIAGICSRESSHLETRPSLWRASPAHTATFSLVTKSVIPFSCGAEITLEYARCVDLPHACGDCLEQIYRRVPVDKLAEQ